MKSGLLKRIANSWPPVNYELLKKEFYFSFAISVCTRLCLVLSFAGFNVAISFCCSRLCLLESDDISNRQ